MQLDYNVWDAMLERIQRSMTKLANIAKLKDNMEWFATRVHWYSCYRVILQQTLTMFYCIWWTFVFDNE